MNRRTIVLALLAVTAMAFTACNKPPPAPEAPAEKAPAPGPEYSDPARQQAYEQAWRKYFAQYEEPAIGEALWVKRVDGTYAGGELKSLTQQDLVLRDGAVDIVVPRGDITPQGAADLFPEAFARREALAEIEESLTRRLLRPPLPMIGSLRYTLSDAIVPRSGPGDRYKRIAIQEFNRGTLLEVRAQKDLWIQVRPRTGGEPFWIPQLSTRPAPGAPEENYTALINRLVQTGYLSGYNAELSEATVNRAIWVGTHPGVREGISRMLASHSARARNTTVEWIDVKDAATGRRLGRYSQAQGYRSQ